MYVCMYAYAKLRVYHCSSSSSFSPPPPPPLVVFVGLGAFGLEQ